MAKTRNFLPQKVGSTAVFTGAPGLANDRRNTIGLSCSLESGSRFSPNGNVKSVYGNIVV